MIVTLGLMVGLAVRLWRTPGDTLTSDWLGSVQDRLAFCQHPLWPSRWMSAGLLASARGDWSRVRLLPDGPLGARRRSATWPRRPWRATSISAATAGSREAAAAGAASGSTRSTRSSTALFFFLPRPVRLLILKDLRTFRRDPAQWSQFLIFFGLLAFYFLNIPRLGYARPVARPGGTWSASSTSR